MKWIETFWRWSSLGISVAALAAVGVAGKQWAEQHALEAVLGSGARTDALTMHWAYSAGCAENVRFPLSADKELQGSSQLTARRMWFSFDLPALLRKRLILPRVIIEDAHLIAARSQAGSHADAVPTDAKLDAAPLAWLHDLHSQTASIDQERFVSGTQVAIDTAMLAQQWQANFGDVHSRAGRIIAEAKDIQQELAEMDNPLRHEARVVASRGRLEELKAELAGLKNSLLKTDKVLREQQSRIREGLLIEKRALQDAAEKFQAPPAAALAELTIHNWLAACIDEPTQYSIVLSQLMCSPFRHSQSVRGSDVRHVDSLTAQFAARSAKIAGDISLLGPESLPIHHAPFTASGSFQMVASSGAEGSEDGGTKARWQMSVGRSLNCICLEGEARKAAAGVAEISLESTAAGQIEAECEVADSDVEGKAEVRLREWLGERSHVAALNRTLSDDRLVRELLDSALTDLDQVPEAIDFRFTRRSGAAQVEFDQHTADWLADELAKAASAHVAKKYDAAIEKLEAHVLSELEAINRAVAVSYNAETQHLQQLLQELKVLQADVMNHLAQRAGSEFARKSAGDVVR